MMHALTNILRHSSVVIWPACRHWLSSSAGSARRCLTRINTDNKIFMLCCLRYLSDDCALSLFLLVTGCTQKVRRIIYFCWRLFYELNLFCNNIWRAEYLIIHTFRIWRQSIIIGNQKPVFYSVQKYVSCDGKFSGHFLICTVRCKIFL